MLSEVHIEQMEARLKAATPPTGFCDQHKFLAKRCQSCAANVFDDCVALLADWRVMRRVVDFVAAHCDKYCQMNGFEQLLDDLYALGTGAGKAPKSWCRHLRWDAENNGWTGTTNPEGPQSAEFVVYDDWDQCPVTSCHAPRPRTP